MSSSAAAAPASSNNAAAASPAESSTETSAEASATPTSTSSSTEATPTETSTTSSESSTTSDAVTSSTPDASSTTPTTTSESTTPTSTSETPTTTSSTSSDESTTSSTSDVVTTIVTQSPTGGGSTGPATVIITSTEASPSQTAGSTADGSSSTSGSSPAIESSSNDDSGLSAGGTIAVAVVVPVVSVAILVLAALWFWRKWKGKKAAEEERRKEVEEYGFNPNNDPTLPAVAAGGAYEPNNDNVSGYRGWGTTSAGRKASTNLSSGAGVGLAMSEASSVPGYHHATSPSDGTIQYSDGQGPPASGEDESIGVLGAAPVAANNRVSDIRRGPSNASSAYSAANRSEASDESHMSTSHPTAPFYEDNPYYNEVHAPYGAYGDGPYGSPPQPVIRDVQARRNTRIENPAVFPRQGNAGIAQNF